MKTGRPEKEIYLDALSEEETGYVTGLFAGDGYRCNDGFRHFIVEFYLNPKSDLKIASKIIDLLKRINLKPSTMIVHKSLRIRVLSKKLFMYVPKIQGSVTMQPDKFLVGYISGLLDSDGYVVKGDMVISNSDKRLIDEAFFILRKLGVYTRIWSSLCTNPRNKTSKSLIWRLRVGTSFRTLQNLSEKIVRVYY